MTFGDHKSWQSYIESLSTPLKFGTEATTQERDQAFEVLREANHYFYAKHVATLPKNIRSEIEKGTHASQSHQRQPQAQLAMDRLCDFLNQNCTLTITKMPTMGLYHGDQIVFSVRFDSNLAWKQIDNQIPPFFEGFRILRVRQSDFETLNPKKIEPDAAPNSSPGGLLKSAGIASPAQSRILLEQAARLLLAPLCFEPPLSESCG